MEIYKKQEAEPNISILMAVYNPRMDWLRAQLQSLNAQTYPKLRLYIRDDCSTNVCAAEIEQAAEESVTAFPYTLTRNETNLGSNATFELLTREAEGECFAYCDQDDIWLPEKLSVLQDEMQRTEALLVCSDMYVIDGEGRRTADSITKVRRHHVFHSGEGLAQGLLFRNFVTGCTMLVNARAAKSAVPFCPYMVHDHYIALWCAEHGKVVTVPRPLIQYRIHGGNQTGVLMGVTDKKSYEKTRIRVALDKITWLEENFACGPELHKTILDGTTWMRARQRSWNHLGGEKLVWKYRRFSPLSSVAEIVMKNFPDKLFAKAICLAQKNQV